MLENPPYDDHKPFSVEELHRNTRQLLDHCRGRPGQYAAADVLQVIVTMLENTQCPHVTCPRLLTEHDTDVHEEH